MKQNRWNKYLKIICSWLLILSMCFLSLDTAIVSAENRSPVNTESEMTGSQDEESTPVENESSMESDPESASEPNENKSTEESSTDNTVSDVPEEISVQSLEEAVQEIDAKGEASSTNRVEYVDAKGTPINGAPATIAYGNISEHKALSIDGRHFDFLSAKVNGKDCVYIGEYNGVLYYSTDGVIAIKMEDGQKVTMTYQEYYLVTIKEELPTNCKPGTICTKKGSEDVPVETNKQIHVNAGEDWVVSVTPGAPNNKKRYKITSVTSQNGANITKNAGDDYGATYAFRFQKDDTITVTYDAEGVYRITINIVDNNGFEYINIAHSEENGWDYIPEQHKLVWTFKESKFSTGDHYLYMPEFHVKRGYRLVHMTVNGYTMDSRSNGYYREVPTSTGTSDELPSSPGNVTIITQMTKEYKSNIGDEANCSYAYAMRLKVRGGAVEDYNFNLAPYSTGKQALTARLYTNQRRNSEGLDVVMWDYEKQKLVPVKDNDVIDMDVVKYDGKSRRQVRIFFVKPRPGYVLTNGLSSATGVSYGLPHGREDGLLDGYKSSANAGKIDTMTETSIISGNNEFYIYTKEWKAAKDAAKKAGYTTYLAWGAADPTNTNWFLYAASFEAVSSNLYVHYNSGAGDGVLPENADVKNIPYNQETNNQNIPMQSYGENPCTYKGARGMGTTFVMGESCPEPTCEGYQFVGWKLKDRSGKLSDTLYKHGDLFTIAEDNYAYANNTDLPLCSWNNESGYQIVAQWKKADTKTVSVEHYLKQPDGKEYLGKTTVGSILFSEEQDTFTIFGNPEPDGTFPGYVFNKEDSRNQTKVIIKKDEISDNYVLKVYYKPTVLTVSKTVKGYTLDEDKAFTFTIQAQAPSGTNPSASIIQDGQIYIRKEGKIEKLTFTNNKATFTLKDKESVDISCLPMEWTYTIEEENPGSNYETTCQKTGGSVVDGRMLSFQMEQESESVSFVNASKVAPPVTGKTVQNNSFILLLVLVFGGGIVSFGFFERIKRKHR